MKKLNSSIFETLPWYAADSKGLKRLKQRSKSVIDPFLTEISGSTVLDLGCHDGRWSYAMAAAGAKSVLGIEGREELVNKFATLPDTDFKSRIRLVCGDIFDELEVLVSRGSKFEIVAVLGILYHVMDHFRLLRLIRQLNPKLVIIDSEFIEAENSMIQLGNEDTENILNSIPQVAGQERAVIGIPSRRAIEAMAEVLGYDTNWVDKKLVFGNDREALHDYFRKHRKVRSTCSLTPRKAIH